MKTKLLTLLHGEIVDAPRQYLPKPKQVQTVSTFNAFSNMNWFERYRLFWIERLNFSKPQNSLK